MNLVELTDLLHVLGEPLEVVEVDLRELLAIGHALLLDDVDQVEVARQSLHNLLSSLFRVKSRIPYTVSDEQLQVEVTRLNVPLYGLSNLVRGVDLPWDPDILSLRNLLDHWFQRKLRALDKLIVQVKDKLLHKDSVRAWIIDHELVKAGLQVGRIDVLAVALVFLEI